MRLHTTRGGEGGRFPEDMPREHVVTLTVPRYLRAMSLIVFQSICPSEPHSLRLGRVNKRRATQSRTDFAGTTELSQESPVSQPKSD